MTHIKMIVRLSLALTVVFASATTALAQFSVDRTQIRLSGRSQSAILKVTNDSATPLQFDVKIFAWDHNEQGEEILTATTEAVAAPGTMTIAPKASQNIRVGTTAQMGAREKTYRVIVEQLPAPRSAGSGAVVAMRMRLSIPVFLEPTNGQATLDLGVPVVRAGVASVMARNAGTVHLQIDSVSFKGMSATGQTTFEVPQGGSYVLAGKAATVNGQQTLTAAQCRATSKIQVSVTVHGETVIHEGPVVAGNCGG